MTMNVKGLDRRLINKKEGNGKWAIVLCKLPNDDVAEVFVDANDAPSFEVGQQLDLDIDFSCIQKKLGVRVNGYKVAKGG